MMLTEWHEHHRLKNIYKKIIFHQPLSFKLIHICLPQPQTAIPLLYGFLRYSLIILEYLSNKWEQIICMWNKNWLQKLIMNTTYKYIYMAWSYWILSKYFKLSTVIVSRITNYLSSSKIFMNIELYCCLHWFFVNKR
jgi:hypothetical protein